MVKETVETISDRLITTICQRISENKSVRRTLPIWGRVHIDRQLPFLCVYRRIKGDDYSRTERLIMGEASYLIASGNRRFQKQLSKLILNIAKTLVAQFGSFLIIEIWLSSEFNEYEELRPLQPAFNIIKPKKTEILSTIEILEKELKKIKIRYKSAKVKTTPSIKISPKRFAPIISVSDAANIGCHLLGIEIRPIHVDYKSENYFPIILRSLHRRFTRALRIGFFEFTRSKTTHRPPHFQSLGRRSMVKAVWEVDRQLAAVSNSFDFLLQVTPINTQAAWAAFQKIHFEKIPEFLYRPLPIDPALTKRKLYKIPLERIEDPTIAQLFREQQFEIDRKLTMLMDRNSSRFRYGSLQLYGDVEVSLSQLAINILDLIPPRSHESSDGGVINATAFAARAKQEIEYFRKSYPEIRSKTIVSGEINGLMVSQGNLLIGKQLKIPVSRIEALIQHEVGTHVLTYHNGRAQPFRQLYVGLTGYDELQEGLAVLAEYLVGGLTRPRLRLLAARVVAALQMINGASFIDVYRELSQEYKFNQYTAFTITTRIFRSGGLTKDAVYLRGLVKLLDYIKQGGDIDILLVGKISANHISIIKEFQWRKVLVPPPLRPSYLFNQEANEKLKKLRSGYSVLNLIERKK